MPNFEENFKILYNNMHEVLFENANLSFTITDEIQSTESLIRFMQDISDFEGIEDIRH